MGNPDSAFRLWIFVAIALGATAMGITEVHLWPGLGCTVGAFGAMFMAARASGG